MKNYKHPDKVAGFYFDSQSLMYKFEDILKNAKRGEKSDEISTSQKSSSNQISINGNVSGSTIIIGNENNVKNS